MTRNANTVILVVDDDNNTRRIIRQILHGLAFRQVEEAKDGPTALDQLMRCNPALIILEAVRKQSL